MKKYKPCKEKLSVSFTKHGLEACLCTSFLLLVWANCNSQLSGVEGAMFFAVFCESLTYILTSVGLVFGGGALIEYTVKNQKA